MSINPILTTRNGAVRRNDGLQDYLLSWAVNIGQFERSLHILVSGVCPDGSECFARNFFAYESFHNGGHHIMTRRIKGLAGLGLVLICRSHIEGDLMTAGIWEKKTLTKSCGMRF